MTEGLTRAPAWIASRSVVAVTGTGEELRVTLRIGAPYEISAEEWACPVAVDGLQGRLRDIRGIDAWQSLQLAQTLQAQVLGHFVEQGGALVWPESGEPMALHELFPQVSGVFRRGRRDADGGVAI